MTPQADIPLDHYPCDRCRDFRPGQPRAFGVSFFDCYWVCADCRAIYDALLATGGGPCPISISQ